MNKPLLLEAELEKLALTIREVEQDLRRRLATNVRLLRLSAGMTQKKAAERSDVYWRHWQKIEAAEVNVTIETLVRIARVLRVDVPELFSATALIKSRGEPS